MKRIFLTTLIIFILIFALMLTVQAQSQQETLNQYISDLQKNPNDNALREKIIRHVQTMKQKPAVPEDAKKYMVRGKAAFKGAKEEKDFNDAADEFKKALLSAPWLAEGYYNLGIVQDKAGQYATAMESLKLYVIAAPNAPDVEKVKELIYEIEYRKDKAAKESSPVAIAGKKQKIFEDLLRRIDGRRYTAKNPHYNEGMYLDVRGKVFVKGAYTFNTGQEAERVRYEIRGRQTTIHEKTIGDGSDIEITYTISEDGDRIIEHSQYSDGSHLDVIYLWKR